MKVVLCQFPTKLAVGIVALAACLTEAQVARAQPPYLILCDTTNNTCIGEIPGGTNYGNNGNFNAGDSWTLTIYATAYAQIDQCDPGGCTSNGYYGEADAYGDFRLYGQFASNDSGCWWETWYAGPYPSDPTNTVNFCVTGSGGGGGGGGSSPCGLSIQPSPPSILFADAEYDFDAACDCYMPTDETASGPSTVQVSTSSACTVTSSASGGGSPGIFGASSSGQNTPNMYYTASVGNAYSPPSPPQSGFCGTFATYYLTVTFTATGAGYSTSTGTVNFELDDEGCFYTF